MKKIIIIFAVVFFISSCSVQKDYYKVLSVGLNFIRNPFTETVPDSLDLDNKSYQLYKNILNDYAEIYLTSYNPKCQHIMPSNSMSFKWIDEKYIKALDSADIDHMKEQILKNEIITWNSKKIKINSKVITTLPFSMKESVDNDKITKRIKNEKYLYQFSTPIFNKHKNKAIIGYKDPFLFYNNLLFFIKEKREWKLVGIGGTSKH